MVDSIIENPLQLKKVNLKVEDAAGNTVVDLGPATESHPQAAETRRASLTGSGGFDIEQRVAEMRAKRAADK